MKQRERSINIVDGVTGAVKNGVINMRAGVRVFIHLHSNRNYGCIYCNILAYCYGTGGVFISR